MRAGRKRQPGSKSYERLLSGRCHNCSDRRMDDSVFCAKHRAKNAGRAGGHGATLHQRNVLYARQDGACPICLKPVRLWDSVDHDHATGQIRGLLHPRCNTVLGLLESMDREAVIRAFAYLLHPRSPVPQQAAWPRGWQPRRKPAPKPPSDGASAQQGATASGPKATSAQTPSATPADAPAQAF